MGSHHGFDACSARKMERMWVEMAREGKARHILRAKRKRGDRVIGRTAMMGSILEEEVSEIGLR